MPDCDYCEAAFDDEDAYLDHLGSEHEGELSRIDSRRVEQHTADPDGGVSPAVVYGISAVVVLALVGAAGYYVLGTLDQEQRIHEHGTIEMVVDGQAVDFDQPQYHSPQSDRQQDFHFHRGDGSTWHMHPSEPGRLTLAEAMAIIDIELAENSVTYQGETYSDDDSETTVQILVNGEPVDPESHELEGGDNPAEGDAVQILVDSPAENADGPGNDGGNDDGTDGNETDGDETAGDDATGDENGTEDASGNGSE